ncbi:MULTISPECIES: ABC transporter ATP-binding protein [Olivibacter]|jgi:ABC-type multidrug transport system fused ATPase/permease subunit|uniref:ABC transporter ATP-binding protein n=1 Tax=Olivibacter oleidegradans TaxID=760123 RepID=A0ABV6HEH1_9SPHI|nr:MULTISPECIES: ABC transporter ATP-binding protein [Olivibacter]MDM8177836.1 ABC transporter ATP-binding protein [Olivibacter sp. 47]
MANPYISLLRTAWTYARGEKKRYVFIYGLFILASAAFATYPLLYGWFINGIQQEGAAYLHYAWLYVGAYMLLKLVEWSFHGPARILEQKLAFALSRNFLQDRYHQTLHLPVKWHQDNHSGITINRIRKAYTALKSFFENGFMYTYALMKFVFSLIAMIAFSPLFGLIGVGIGMLTVYVIFRFDKPYIKALDETNEKDHIVSGTLFDSLSNIITVITLRLQNRMEKSLMGKVADVYPPYKTSVHVNEFKWFIADMLVALIYVVTVLGYIYQHGQPGQLFLIGNLVALLGFVNQFTSVFHDVAWQYTQIVQFNTDVETSRHISDAYQQQHQAEATVALPNEWQQVEVQGLNFSHTETYSSGQNAHSLHDIHLTIQRGQKIALIGESGSGKSTLMAILRGLYTYQSDTRIRLDGSKQIDAASLADAVTLFPQEPEIFENTIKHNITLGLPFSDEEVMEVCRIAHFAEVVQTLPKGLESHIQEKGVNLSGGQKQRLALARGILAARSSSIVLLDEPTSSIDPKTEVKIYQHLFEEFKEKALISSLHRLYLLPYFDYIYILQNGRIVDEGNFVDLKARSVLFDELWKHQRENSQTGN